MGTCFVPYLRVSAIMGAHDDVGQLIKAILARPCLRWEGGGSGRLISADDAVSGLAILLMHTNCVRMQAATWGLTDGPTAPGVISNMSFHQTSRIAPAIDLAVRAS